MNGRTVIAFVGMCLTGLILPTSGHCDLVQTINIHLVARILTLSTNEGDTHIQTIKTVPIGTKEVLDMLGNVTSNDFGGATLVSVHRGQAYQVRRGTNVLADVSQFFIDEDVSDDVASQSFNGVTGKDNYHGFWLKTWTFDDQHGNRFTVNGMVEEHYKAPTVDAQGMQDVSDLYNYKSCTGSGTLQTSSSPDGQFALFSGTIIFSGKGEVPLNTF